MDKTVHGVTKLTPVLIDCTDGHGKRSSMLFLTDGERLFGVTGSDGPVQLVPASGWLSKGASEKLSGMSGGVHP